MMKFEIKGKGGGGGMFSTETTWGKVESLTTLTNSPLVKKPLPNEKEYPAYIMEKITAHPVKMYCVKCRTQKEVFDAEKVRMKNGKPALRAKCSKCNTGMYKIGAR